VTNLRVPALISAMLVALCVVIGPADVAAAKQRPELGKPGEDPPTYESGEILVQFKPGARGQEIAEAHRQGGGQTREVLSDIDVHVVQVPPGQEKARVAVYRHNPNVQFAELNAHYFAQAFSPPNDPRVGSQWQYNNTGQAGGTPGADIRAFKAWNVTPGSSTVAIAVLDTGIDQHHEDLPIGPKVTKQVKFAPGPTLDDRYGHGTHVAGSASARTGNGLGVSGTCPNCVIYNVKVLGDDGSGSWSGIANGITWAAKNGAKVITMSFGAYSPSSTVESAVNFAWSKGVVLTAAAGNDGQNWGFYPGVYSNVIAVAATDESDLKAGFSNYGANWVDVAAPGQDILSTAPTHATTLWGSIVNYGTISGTSMATPHVAGIAALVWSSGLCTTNACVRGRVEGKADPTAGTGDYWSKGRVNACRAVTDSPTAC
jgi:thermitase